MRNDEAKGERMTGAEAFGMNLLFATVIILGCVVIWFCVHLLTQDGLSGSAEERSTFLSELWPRYMEQCRSREPDYVCIVKVRDAVNAAYEFRAMSANGVEEQR